MPVNLYKFGTRLADDLCGLIHPRYGRQIWSKVKMKKVAKCIVTGKPLGPGSIAYRPITNGSNRMRRISEEGMKELEVDR